MLALCVSFLVALLDQITKSLVGQNLRVGGSIPVIPGFFDLRYVQNTGAAWGMFEGFSGWLIVISIVMLVVIVVFRRSFVMDALIYRLTMGLLVGGIVGNLIDRVRLGYVVDFLDFYWRGHHFPAFNAADAAICVGVGLYVISQRFAVQANDRQ